MANVTRKDLFISVRNDVNSHTYDKCREIHNSLLDIIVDQAFKGNQIIFSKLGIFNAPIRSPRKVMNFQKGQLMVLGERQTLKFVPSRGLDLKE